MNDELLVSVVLPFYQAPNLNTAIDSILSQSYPHFELLLIDNNSDVATRSIALKYIKDQHVKLIKEPRQGVVFAMNKGIENAKGEYIMRMDADDYAYPDRIRKQLSSLQEDPDIGVVSGGVVYHGNEENEGFRLYVDWLNSIMSNDEIHINQFVEFPMANPSLMFRTHLP